MIHWQRNGPSGLLDSSSWGNSMASCQEPLTIQLFSVVLNGFFTPIFNTYSCEVIHPGMNITSVFMDLPVIVTLISGVTYPWNPSKNGIPWSSVPHHQQPSGIWHLTTDILCICSSGTFLWFRITCVGNMLPSANTSKITVTQVIFLFTMSYHMWQKSNKLLL